MESSNAISLAAEAIMDDLEGPSSRDTVAEANMDAIGFPPSNVVRGDYISLAFGAAEKGKGGDDEISLCSDSLRHVQQPVRLIRSGVADNAQTLAQRVAELSSLRVAIESSFMQCIRSSIKDYMSQVYGDSLSEIPPTSYRRTLSVDDSELPSQPVLALPWEEYRCHSPSVMPLEPEDIENVNREISAHIISLQKARDSTRRVTRSAIKPNSNSIINDA